MVLAGLAACTPGPVPVHGQGSKCAPTSAGTAAAWHAELPSTCPPPTFGGAMAPMVIGGEPVVVLFGGSELGETDADVNEASNETWTWDGTSWTLLHPSVSPPALKGARLVADSTHGGLVLFGGSGSSDEATSFTYTFDGTTWTDRTDYDDLRTNDHTPPARYGAMLADDVADGGVALYGGRTRDILAGDGLNDLWLWNGSTWSPLDAGTPEDTCNTTLKPCTRSEAVMAPDPLTGGVVLFGGRTDIASDPSDETWVWNGAAWLKSAPLHVPGARVDSVFARFDSSTDVLFGGDPEGTGDDAWSWDGIDWTAVPAAPAPRSLAQMAVLGSTASRTARMVVFGGASTHPHVNDKGQPVSFDVFDDTWSYDPTAAPPPPPPPTHGWLELQAKGAASATQPSGRSEAAMATFVAPSGVYEALLFGGAPSAGGAPLGDTWLWDGSSWSELTFPAGARPPARQSASMAWDNTSNDVVLFGGRDGSAPPTNLSDTWVFDPTTMSWSQPTPCTTAGCSPSGRRQAAMASDIVDFGVMLFGGTNSTGGLDDTWVWSFGAWSQKVVAGPPSRSQSVMGIDLTSLGVVLFGGNHFSGGVTTILDDTWIWDGSTWTQQSPATSPSARYESTMASLDTVTVLFGGNPAGGGSQLADTWEWDGTDWTETSPSTSPSGRASSVATGAQTSAGDPSVNMLLFGGAPAGADNDTWRYAP
jgi:hypothetical protein